MNRPVAFRCSNCGADIKSIRRTKRFCSDRCRKAFSSGPECPSPMQRNVTSKGTMTENGYKPENDDWDPWLTEVVKGKRVGRNPMEIDPEILKKAGHGHRRTRDVVSAVPLEVPESDGIATYKDIRRLCLECSSGSKGEVRRCSRIDCAAWPYRMGKNPHNSRRGKNPFPNKNQPSGPPEENQAVKPKKVPVSGNSICEIKEGDTSQLISSFENLNASNRGFFHLQQEEDE